MTQRVRIKSKGGEVLVTGTIRGDWFTPSVSERGASETSLATLSGLNLTVEPIDPPKKKRLLAWRCVRTIFTNDGDDKYTPGQIVMWPESGMEAKNYFERVPHLDEPEDK